MKIFEKVKKCLISFATFLLLIPAKVLARARPDYQPAYGVDSEYLDRLNAITMTLKIVKFFIIPIVTVVGLIIFFKKSKSSNKKKVLATIGILFIIAIVYFVINSLGY